MPKTKTAKQKRAAAKKPATSRKKTKKPALTESDSQYFLKLVMYLILGTVWLRIEKFPDWQIPLPVGLLVGLVLIQYERFQFDRKIEYAVLLIATLVGFWLPLGIRLSL